MVSSWIISDSRIGRKKNVKIDQDRDFNDFCFFSAKAIKYYPSLILRPYLESSHQDEPFGLNFIYLKEDLKVYFWTSHNIFKI